MEIVTDKVFEYPTVIVPKSRFSGLIAIMPSAPAPTICRYLLDYADYCIMLKVLWLFMWVSVRPEPGEKKPTAFLTWSNKFFVKSGTMIWYSLRLKGVKTACT